MSYACRNCGAPKSGQRCPHCGSHTGSHKIVKPQTERPLERRRPLNAGIRRIYEAMIRSGALRR